MFTIKNNLGKIIIFLIILIIIIHIFTEKEYFEVPGFGWVNDWLNWMGWIKNIPVVGVFSFWSSFVLSILLPIGCFIGVIVSIFKMIKK